MSLGLCSLKITHSQFMNRGKGMGHTWTVQQVFILGDYEAINLRLKCSSIGSSIVDKAVKSDMSLWTMPGDRFIYFLSNRQNPQQSPIPNLGEPHLGTKLGS